MGEKAKTQFYFISLGNGHNLVGKKNQSENSILFKLPHNKPCN